MSGKFALIIGNTEYSDPGLAQLSAPGKDAEDFARVLKDQEIGAFDNVSILLNHLSYSIIEAIEDFFDQKKPDDLLVLYFSGHGIRDEFGALYLAVKNTFLSRLRSTAIKSDYIRDAMDQSRSKRQVLILDCCNSGAFSQGTKAATGTSIGTASAFEGKGYGRVVLTASDSTQFAWEGEKIIGETSNSLFTHFLVKGLEGEADQDHDGIITVDELYDYAYAQVVDVTPKQTPGKWSYKEQGEIILRRYISSENLTSSTAKLRRKLFEQAKYFQTKQAKLLQEKAELEVAALAARKAKEEKLATQTHIAHGKTQNESNRPVEQKVEQKKSALNSSVLVLGGVFGVFLTIGLCVIAAFIIVANLKPSATPAPLPTIAPSPIPPTSTTIPFTPTPENIGIPIITSVDLENDMSSGELVILQKIAFEDSQGDVNFVDFKIVSTTATDLIIKSGTVDISADEQKSGAVITGEWRCGSASYSVTLQVFVKDAKGNQSDPFTYTMLCNLN